MKSLKIALWISAIGCLLAFPFMLLPWGIIENIFLWFGFDPIPDISIAMYFLRIACGVFGLIGIYFIILARNPLNYGAMLNLGAYGLILFGLSSLIIGWSLKIPLKFYIGDTLFGLVLGVIITTLYFKVKRDSID